MARQPIGGIGGSTSVVQRRGASETTPSLDLPGAAGVPLGPTTGTPLGNAGLPDLLRTRIEQRSGLAMDDVRVHRNSVRPAAIGALAFAQGRDIHLGPGQERHLPHEAWHVVQQKQGRVRPDGETAEGVPINDSPTLEREADRFGAEPSVGADRGTRLRDIAPPSFAPLQAMWVVRDGKWKWVEDELEEGDATPELFYHQPRVLVSKSTSAGLFGSTGDISYEKAEKPATHKDLQQIREEQGGQLRERLVADPKKIKGYTQKLNELAEKLEELAGKSVPKNHEKKVKNYVDSGPEGGNFRAIIPGQDELTQSQATSHFLTGLLKEGDDEDLTEKQLKQLRRYVIAAARVMSSLRVPTETVVFPITLESGKRGGQQHPTRDDQEVLETGRSGHTYADRARVEAQTNIFSSALEDTEAPPNMVFLVSVLSAVLFTLRSMSGPTASSNLPEFQQDRAEEQTDEREAIKKMAHELLRAIKQPFDEEKTQPIKGKVQSHEEPFSPFRTTEVDDDQGTDLTDLLSLPSLDDDTGSSTPTVVPTVLPSPLSLAPKRKKNDVQPPKEKDKRRKAKRTSSPRSTKSHRTTKNRDSSSKRHSSRSTKVVDTPKKRDRSPAPSRARTNSRETKRARGTKTPPRSKDMSDEESEEY